MLVETGVIFRGHRVWLELGEVRTLEEIREEVIKFQVQVEHLTTVPALPKQAPKTAEDLPSTDPFNPAEHHRR